MQKNRSRLLSSRDDVSSRDSVLPSGRPRGGDQSTYNLVQAVDRAVSIVEELAGAPKGLTIGELCDRLDMHKATIYRILSTLVFRGYVEEDLRTAVYRLNLKIFDIAKKVLRGRSLLDEVQPVLDRLRKKTREDVGLVLVDRDELVVAQNGENLLSLMVRKKAPGLQPKLLSAAARKLLLADLPEHERKRVMASLTDAEHASLGISSEEELQGFADLVQLQGFVIDDRSTGEGARCVVVPIRNYLGEVVGVIGVSAPLDRAALDHVLKLAHDAKDAADNVSRRLGYEPPGTS